MAVRLRKGILAERKDSKDGNSSVLTIQKRSVTTITTTSPKRITSPPPVTTNIPQRQKMAGEIGFSHLGNSTRNKNNSANNCNTGNTKNSLKTPRKLWTLQDRSAMSVNLLKANLAEDGCEEAQLDVAKKLLNDALMSPDALRNETTRLAVYWLVKSSEQGNEEATQLLEDCLKTGRGITCQNILDVKSCIDTCRNEKFTFKAARILHAKLSNGEEFITTNQLRARLQSKKDRSSPIRSPASPVSPLPEDSSSDNESENNFSSPYYSSNGLNTTFTVDPDNHDNYNIRGSETQNDTEYGADSKYLLGAVNNNYSIPGVKMTLEDMLRTASTHNAGEIPPIAIHPSDIVPEDERWNMISLLSAFVLPLILVAYLTDTIGCSNCILHGFAYLLAWSSYNLRLWRKRQNNFRAWTDSFKSVLKEGDWNETISEKRLVSNWLRPYLAGSTASLLGFTFLPHSFAKVTCGIIMLLSLCRAHRDIKFRPKSRILLLVILPFLGSFGGYLRDFESIRLGLDNFGLPDYFSTITGVLHDNVYVNLPESEYITASLLMKIFQGIVVLSLAWSAKSILLDFLILFWFQMTITWCMALSVEELATSGILVICAESIYYLVRVTRNKKLSWTSILTLLTTTVIIVISLGVVQYFSANNYAYPSGGNVQYLGWDEYNSNCHTQAWQSKSQNVAQTQIQCSLKYENFPVKWTGVISIVKLHQMDKVTKGGIRGAVFEVLVNIFDGSVKNEGTEAENSWNWLGFDGNVNKNDGNDFKPPPITVWLSTKDLENGKRIRGTKYVLNLRTGDKIEFDGILVKNMGGLQPEIGLVKSVKCVSCTVADYGEVVFGKQRLEIIQNLDDAYQTLMHLIEKLSKYVQDFILS